MTQYTLTYSEKNKGWTSFHGWFPSLICSLSNKFFTIKNGQLWEHYDRDNQTHNVFYGESLPSKIVTIFNENFDFDKIYKTLVLEGNRPWNVKLFTNYTEGTLTDTEFESIESRFFAYLRGSEDASDMHGLAIQGIGNIISVDGTEITFDKVPDSVNIGDEILQINSNVPQVIGTISAHTATTITVSAVTNTPIADNYSYIEKNRRVEGSEIRGYYMQVELTNEDGGMVELFGINTNEVKSYI